eukprot:GILJ01021410.1.p1 GENE.GILJ01021410.1~~GILJ01021410.1.p1  ORF type:complete len:172 (-),score=21.32 GILJ01021410.1:533-1048(-)
MATASSPPTEIHNQIVRLTAMTLHERCTENRHMENSTQSKFHSSRVPQITMWDYLKRIAKYSACSPECFIISIIYLDRYVAATQIALTFRNIHRLTITAVMVSAKLRDDVYYANSYYASIGGVSNVELNMLEMEFLTTIGWDTWVEPSQYDLYVSELFRIFGSAMLEAPAS